MRASACLHVVVVVAAVTGAVQCAAYDRARYGALVDGSSNDAVRDGTSDSNTDVIDARDVATVDTGTDAPDVVTSDVPIDTTTDVPAEACVPSTETCNGRDDDCDGMTDEGFDLSADTANCGSCGHACLLAHSAPMCVGGHCVPTCVSGWADCDADPMNGCESDLSLPAHCGSCAHACSGASVTCDARGACSDEYAAEIEASGNTSCVRRINGTVWCWGHNVEGVVGDGTLFDRPAPVQVFGLANAIAITGSDHHKCALRSDRTVWCWGSNESGALGDGTNTIRAAPVQVVGLTDAVAIQGGRHHVCARRATGAITCWGRNVEGELADGTLTSRYMPVVSTGTAGITQLGSHGYTNCGLAGTGILCWGRGSSGEIGDGTMLGAQGTPTAVAGITDAAEVRMGYAFGCARRTNGHVICWGANASGQMGDGTRGTTLRLAPSTEVTGIADASEIGLGYTHACAIRTGRVLSCWGANGSGELGDGTTSTRSTPVSVVGLTNVIQVEGGDDHTCALLADGTVECWGSNAFGQLGDGTMFDHVVPARVVGIP